MEAGRTPAPVPSSPRRRLDRGWRAAADRGHADRSPEPRHGHRPARSSCPRVPSGRWRRCAPPLMPTRRLPSRPVSGSMTRPPAITRSYGPDSFGSLSSPARAVLLTAAARPTAAAPTSRSRRLMLDSGMDSLLRMRGTVGEEAYPPRHGPSITKQAGVRVVRGPLRRGGCWTSRWVTRPDAGEVLDVDVLGEIAPSTSRRTAPPWTLAARDLGLCRTRHHTDSNGEGGCAHTCIDRAWSPHHPRARSGRPTRRGTPGAPLRPWYKFRIRSESKES